MEAWIDLQARYQKSEVTRDGRRRVSLSISRSGESQYSKVSKLCVSDLSSVVRGVAIVKKRTFVDRRRLMVSQVRDGVSQRAVARVECRSARCSAGWLEREICRWMKLTGLLGLTIRRLQSFQCVFIVFAEAAETWISRSVPIHIAARRWGRGDWRARRGRGRTPGRLRRQRPWRRCPPESKRQPASRLRC